MTALVMRSMSRVRGQFAAILAVLVGFQITLIGTAAAVARSGDFERIAQMVPAQLRVALSPVLTSFGNMATLAYFDVLIVMIVVVWAIYVATEPAGEIETGLIDLVLARPMPRHRVVTRSLIVSLGSTLALTLGMVLGSLFGLLVLAPDGVAWPEPRIVALMIAHLTALAWCFGAAGVAVSGWARRRASALGYVVVVALAMFLLDFLGLWWAPLGQLARLTPFYYFHGGAILGGTANATLDLTVLGAVTIAASVVAYWQFERRDL